MAYYGETVAQASLIGVALGLAFSFDLTASVLIVTLGVSLLLVVLSRQQVVPFDSLLGLLAHAALAFVWRPLLSLSVHEDLAAAEGLPTERLKLIFVLVMALVVAIAIKIVGALLTIAFLIMPAAAARPLSETPEQMALFAAIFGMLSVVLGLFVSVSFDTPGGPSIVLMLALFFVVSIIPTILRHRG